MPDVDHSIGDRNTFLISNLTLDQNDFRFLVRAVVHAGKAVADRRTCNIQRAFNSARGAASQAGLLILSILADVQIAVHSQARGQQRSFTVGAQLTDVIHGAPKLLRRNIEIFDDLENVVHDTVNDFLHPFITTGFVEAGNLLQQFLHIGSLHRFNGHCRSPQFLVFVAQNVQINQQQAFYGAWVWVCAGFL